MTDNTTKLIRNSITPVIVESNSPVPKLCNTDVTIGNPTKKVNSVDHMDHSNKVAPSALTLKMARLILSDIFILPPY